MLGLKWNHVTRWFYMKINMLCHWNKQKRHVSTSSLKNKANRFEHLCRRRHSAHLVVTFGRTDRSWQPNRNEAQVLMRFEFPLPFVVKCTTIQVAFSVRKHKQGSTVSIHHEEKWSAVYFKCLLIKTTVTFFFFSPTCKCNTSEQITQRDS